MRLVTTDRALLSGVIDYAGLFPPASLDMASAVGEYQEARAGSRAWILGRFVCPASRLAELAGTLMASMKVGETPWGISVVLDGHPGSAAVAARSFHAEMDPAAIVSMLEMKLPPETCSVGDATVAAGELAPFVTVALSVSPAVTPFFEIAPTSQWRVGIPAAVGGLEQHRRRGRRPLGAQLRCGGSHAKAFPTVEQVVTFMRACREHSIPFKATAGLHHPIRHHDPELDVMRHGFLNLLFAAVLCDAGEPEETLRAVLEDTDELSFSVGPASLRWRDRAVAARRVQQVRAERFASYGSCSFDEPIADLVTLGMLGNAP